MRNICLKLAYDGTNYVGWQVQPNGVSVQSTVEAAILRLTGEEVHLFAAGRTDAGVHAVGQVANFYTDKNLRTDKIRLGLQSYLPRDVVVRDVQEVPQDFHATYSARSKRYRYIIHNMPAGFPFLRQYAFHVFKRLDIVAMQSAADALLGTHDFRCFESNFPNKSSSVRTVIEAKLGRSDVWPLMPEDRAPRHVESDTAEFLWFDIVADGFLYNMVRAIVGTLFEVGRGKLDPTEMQHIIERQTRAHAGQTAPPDGLYLMHVDYGDQT